MSDPTIEYCRGYLLTPLLEAVHERGLFALLDQQEFRGRQALIDSLNANGGSFTVALDALESEGWVERSGDDAYRLAAGANGFAPRGMAELYASEPESLSGETPARLFAAKIGELLDRSATETRDRAYFPWGAVVVPVVAYLQARGVRDVAEARSALGPQLWEAVARLFTAQQWLTPDSAEWTVAGDALLRREEFQRVAWYRPLLHALPVFLFGDPGDAVRVLRDRAIRDSLRSAALANRDAEAGLLESIREIFDQEPAGKQPRAIVEIESGDGRLLDEAYQTIQTRTRRGAHLAEAPVVLVAADEHREHREATAERLAGVPHETVAAVIDDPEQLAAALDRAGLPADQDVLHLRRAVDSLLDVAPDQTVNPAVSVLAADQPAHYLDREGGLVDAAAVLSRQQEHLRSLAQSIGPSRLITLQAHAAPSLLRDLEGLRVDWLHRLAGECPITAEAFITLAASVGLFNDDVVKRYPRSSRPCEISLHDLTKREYVVRQALESDVERLDEIERVCWQHTRTPREQIRARIRNYPQGQFVLEKDGEVLGVIYSQRIKDSEALMTRVAANVHELHDVSGTIIQPLAVNIDPRVQNASYGDQLLEFLLQRSSVMTGVDRVAAVTLCKNYDASRDESFEEYIRRQGSSQDPVLAFHQAHGAEIVQVIPGYRPEDHANLNNGVLVEYDILHRLPRHQRQEPGGQAASVADAAAAVVDAQQIARFVREETATLLGLGAGEVDIDRPVMEMGLDSADLLKLQRLCEERFGVKLQAGFFFEHSSIRKVIEYMAIRLAAPEEAGSAMTATGAEIPHRPPTPELDSDEIADVDRFAETDIAIIGISCKLPGGIETPDELWQALAANECVIGAFPESRRGWPNPAEYPGIDQGGFVNDADAFDAPFFRISPAEAEITDPQQRILLELAWACLEDAGILPAALKGTKTGVFVGASNCDYSRLVQEAGLDPEAHHGVGSSLAILANRLSYFFDFSGPSLVVDTACSSSLVALHSAVQSLRSGECAAALVGGVNLICHPDLSIAYHKAGMLARDGRCKVFDARADGYARSEGAVVFFLKPLPAAVADGNQIHAVIRGSAINHGGLAGGLTVPNPQKQKELLIAAWTDAGIAANDLTYIEAHGTGTPLGDPIELQGIQSAYTQHLGAEPSRPCAIGSIKSNLGHLEPAAGITGLLKVILSFQHQQLPASVNFTQLNPRIVLGDGPFFIQEHLGAWDTAQPRIAAVSSFGSGGTNAHVVVQEYPRARSATPAEGEYLLVLSAANQDRLRIYAEQVHDWLTRQAADLNLADAVYTLHVGRTAMKHRLAVKAKDAADLLNKLRSWLAGDSDLADVWSGQVVQKDSAIDRAWQTKAGRQLIDHALAERDVEPLAALWSSGTEIDWRKYYAGADAAGRKPRTVSVPTYPFAKERYWIDIAAVGQGASGSAASLAAANAVHPLLHPLLHTNSSDLSQQSYSATFSGEEFFLADHQVRGDGRNAQKVLPGVAYLEMARTAVENALPTRPVSAILELRNTVWVQPVVVAARKQISIALMANENDHIDFEIYSQDTEQEIVHCQGRAFLSRQPAPARLDLEQLAAQMSLGREEPEAIYARFGRMGFLYGPSFQGITSIDRGTEQLLARLRLPEIVEDTSEDYVLHPSMMDGAVQAAVELIDGAYERSNQPRLPFALETLRIISPCTPQMVAWVRYAPGSKAGDNVLKADIDLCDERGNVCVQLHGLSSRVLSKEIRSAAGAVKAAGSLLATPVWRPSDVEAFLDEGSVDYVEHHVLLCDMPKVDVERLRSSLPEVRCVPLETSGHSNIAKRYSEAALACFERVQDILQSKPSGKVLVQIVVADEGEETMLAGLSGLLKTASLENPLLAGQLILVPAITTAEELAARLLDERSVGVETLVRYEEDTRLVLRWEDVAADPETPPTGFKDHGVYLITGGLGGLGVVFAKEILAQTRYGRVVLTGRSALNAEKQARLDALSTQAGRLSYRHVDICNPDQVKRLVVSIRDEYGQLNGVLHSAGMIADNFILKKSSAEFSKVLAPKVTGTFDLDQATADVELDFFVLFSSTSGALGNPGQADYAAANAFMDQFAAYRNQQVALKQRHGRTRSINWPLWQSGGMKMDLATQELLEETTGLQAMRTATGLRAFHRCLALPYNQILVVEGNVAQIRRTLLDAPSLSTPPPPEQPVLTADVDGETLSEKTQEYLRKQFSGVLKLPAHRIDAQAPLEEYGIDSMLAMKLTSQLEETFGSLSKTLFFEYQTIRELTRYFIAHYSSQLAALFAIDRAPEAAPAAAKAALPTPSASISTRRTSRARNVVTVQSKDFDAIAIIGLSGRYPEAIDVDAFWNNLRDGKDCVIEVPSDRWDWRTYFSNDRTSSGRHYSKWGGFIAGVDEFDPLFFNISPRDAKYIDPQERLFLQHSWMAMEDAGYTRAGLQVPDEHDLAGQVGVYAGVMWSEYQLLGSEANLQELRMAFAGNVASIANRVSYVFNLHGPSVTVDTMCSSSLTAIHFACQDLKLGRTSMAIAGGVNVSVHPNKYLMLSLGQFISSDGHCQSFGEGGDGYIPGEGVGVVVLKRLAEARRDGDHIYGIIRGSALTHGGKTNGYTVPNPPAQSSAISRALKESGTDARHISYIEAHGTGTKLGDPIEIAGLNKAFHQHTQDTGFCLIGSAKSNIGHCESAAGIAGLTKVLLQMEHQQIVPSLHSAQLNPHIDFTRSPFVVNQALTTWEQPLIDGRKMPRIAGISSFGAGGSNAHIIVEESPAPVQQRIAGNVIIVLSARTAEQLKQKARDLLGFVRSKLATIDLAGMAYTLQVGREAMEERLGFVAGSVEQVVETLEAFVAGEPDIEGAYQGQVKRSKESLSMFSTDTDLQQAVEKWIAGRKLARLLEMWVEGLELDWTKLYGDARPQRMRLPVYPFARERYWIDTATPRPSQELTTAVLHPLLHSNTSDLTGQSYRSTFTGQELFVSDQSGKKVLTAAACLEMARAAVEHATPARSEPSVLELQNIVWAQPIVVGDGTPVAIALFPEDNGQIDFEIFTTEADQEVIHCQGSAVFSHAEPARIDLELLRAQGQRLVQLPADDSGGYVLHPVLLDRALTAAAGPNGGSAVALDLLRILSPFTPEMVAWVRSSDGASPADDVLRFDVDLCDERGNVGVQIRGFSWQQPVTTAIEALIEAPAPAPAPVLMHREIAFLPSAPFAESPKAAPAERKKRTAVSLAMPGGNAAPPPSSSAARTRITLSNAAQSAPAPGRASAAGSPVRLYDSGNGIFSIEIASSRSAEVIAHTLQALERVEQDASVKVLMLSGIEHCFMQGGRGEFNDAVEQGLFQRLASFAYPVVAALPGDVIGAGFLAAALCDFMVCNEDAHYGYTDAEHHFYPTPAELVLFGERFGYVLAEDFLYVTTYSTGRELRAEGWTCPIVAGSQVEAQAQQLASTLATKPQEALRLLKVHLTRHVAGLAGSLVAVQPADGPAAESSADVAVIRYGRAGLLDVDDLRPYKAVVLLGQDPDIPDAVVADLQRVILESEIPVVAALVGDAKGNAWLVSQYCDARVYSKSGVYSSANIGTALAQTAVAVFEHRFGHEAASEILLTGAEYSGADLQQRVDALTVAEEDLVLRAAQQIAASWARLPRPTLAAWKRHTAATLQDRIGSLPRAEGPERDEAALPAPGAVPLQSRVLSLTVHAEGVVVVKMEDRDAKNMFSDAFVQGVKEVFALIDRTPNYKVVILTGYDNYFASGGTKEGLLAIQEGKTKFTDFGIFHAALECKLPVIAAMQGHGIGAGWSLGMFADIVLLSDESRYVSPYMNYGFTPGAGATYSLTEKMGPDLARESLLTAQQYAGRELKERGLTLRVVPRAEVYPEAMTLARRIARVSRGHLIDLKRQLTAGVQEILEETYRRELAMHEKTFVGRQDTLAQIQSQFHQEAGPAAAPPQPQAIVPASAPVASAFVASDVLQGVTATLRTLLANELQMRESDLDDGAQFVDLGLDSITGVTWIRKINQKYETSIEATKVYSYPTLTQLSRYVRDEAVKRGTLSDEPVAAPVAAPVPAAPAPVPTQHAAPPAKVTARPATGKLTSRRGRASSRGASPVSAARPSQAIAVIGMAGQFPQANNVEEYWQNIAEGKNCITEIPRSRWDADAAYQAGDPVEGKTNSRWMGALEEYDRFDPLFFNISPTEAESMDPQQRLFLQACWHSIENAGYDARVLSGSKCGVFVGCGAGDYQQLSRKNQLSAQGFTGSATSILAARISYWLNLQGPCLSIDTACSSSLVAIAQACDSLSSGVSDLALAGGVYVMATPEMHIKTAQAGMLSPEGRCFTFDHRADGFVPGEAAGVVMLKRLADAERDRDIIYGVIEGWGVNQDGKTNGITAPNPESQTRLEREVYDKYQIDPASIQLIEAHGTGTRLGDPIEVEGLRNAFAGYTDKKAYCALGSVKSNIGHCLNAAGITGVIKLVLALKNKQLPPTINFEQLNEHIDLKDSPFYVNTRLQEWKLDGAPRRHAAVSSFGFSGTNAHVVIGEYVQPAEVSRPASMAPPDAKAIVLLSARTAEQLRQKARDLLAFIRKGAPSSDLTEIAYTLQVGRVAMDERLGFVVGSLEELAQKLQAYVDGEQRIDDAYYGHAQRNRESLSILTQDEEMKDAIVSKWMAQRKLSKLLNLWVKGLEVDWRALYGEAMPRRVSLPAYPFAKERYWIETPDGYFESEGIPAAIRHPLLQRNTSDLTVRRYSSTFSGEEFFLDDHRVRTDGRTAHKVLPGVAYLEMARAAVQQTWPMQLESSILELHDTVWLQPVIVDRDEDVSIALFTADEERVDYEIYSGKDGQLTVHCQGQAAFSLPSAPRRLDLEQLRRQMGQGRLDASAVYAIFTTMGLHYGPAHQGIAALDLGTDQLLAELRLPPVVDTTGHEYVLHPTLMDSALQASIGLIVDRNHVPEKPAVPFAVDSVRIVSACTREMAAWVRYSAGSKPADLELDIDLCDAQGNVCVEIRGFTLRFIEGEGKPGRVLEDDASFDGVFYERLIADVLNGGMSVDEATKLG